MTVFGRDYDTPDGTCIRDYLHIEDLCSAHALELDALLGGDQARLVADSHKASSELVWQPRYADLALMIEHTWRWEQKHPGPDARRRPEPAELPVGRAIA